ncbi:nucleotidyltransferase [Sulfolobus sp. A20]|uniref:nucleotidyltransferase family protein n=1 Tax=Sulfolobaceae TaxID=118883 RepID=UPI00084610AA|nr:MULTISPECIES: sugar phosphate nucleotidyltransferase [unclassified Sulfolobus]TRM74303.1 nucleotidyltransferase [Sulfolobus sp. B5]TRM75884.1 nucleotidyltransferase [Sulfolobus sp. A20-N-F8]TRM76351.1 nucleotidyltransferase [Sulfolobus sp. E5]TRM85104.1 nucleotidyltransferase [Sulfolobus sp. F3]TRM89744.1 nucleotidyltransferase [Sulfolobus sp. C3]TRN01210.1 nucleotidyltransferase [Sulfolobus sp. F1]TRN03474.1 nucleotidyltransferase [Sulfolobus sp. E1]
MLRKAIITSAGRGSRMKHITTFLPKALLPLFVTENGGKVTRPIIDLILDSLKNIGIEKFCIVVGKNGMLLMQYLFERTPTFVFQETPKGFGDAVLRAEDFSGNEPFFVHADDGVLTKGYDSLKSLYEEISPDALLLVRRVQNPKRYGVVEVVDKGYYDNHKMYKVTDAEEKPQFPKSNLGLVAVYIFKPSIFDALKRVKVEENRELELTYGIKNLILDNREVYALEMKESETWLNVGDPKSYLDSLNYSFKLL